MKKYEYKVDYFQANVSTADVEKGVAGSKIANQVEKKINQLMDQGFEFYRQFETTVEVKPGCLGGILGKKVEYSTITTTVFRKGVELA